MKTELGLEIDTGYSWEKRKGPLDSNCGAVWSLFLNDEFTGWRVVHCGHPTAHRPYYIEGSYPEGMMLPKFRTVAWAKEQCLKDHERWAAGKKTWTEELNGSSG
jgi:hypothetical protein